MIDSIPEGQLRVLPLGGLGEIGMNCLVLEYQDEIIVVDCGVLFSDNDHFGVDFVVPDFSYLVERKEKIRALIVTHGHEDHIGAIAFALRAGIRAPIYASPFAVRLVQKRLKEYGLDSQVEFRNLAAGNRIEFKQFKIRTVSVNHSIVEANALIIDTPIGKVVHTGDFKIDPDPYFGTQTDLSPFKEAGDQGVVLLLSDSTNVEQDAPKLGEKQLLEKFEENVSRVEGMAIFSVFSSNIARISQILELSQKLGKKVAVTGRSVSQNLQIAIECGYLRKFASVLIDIDEVANFPRDQVIVICSGTQCEFGSALNRIAYGDHRNVQLQKGDLVVLSARAIPGNEKPIGRTINELYKREAEVLHGSSHQIHVSGHATKSELEKMIRAVRPQYFIPVHGEYRHLVHHANLAKASGVRSENCPVLVNGDVLDIAPKEAKKVGHLEDAWVLVGKGGREVPREVVKQRRKLAMAGIVVPHRLENESQFELNSQGVFTSLEREEKQAEAKEYLRRFLESYRSAPSSREFNDLSEAVRVELRRYFNRELGAKPIVLPILK